MTHCCSKTGLRSFHVSFNLREKYRILLDIFCIKPLLTSCLVCHILSCFIVFFKKVTYVPMSAKGHLGSKELICQISCLQWVKYCVCFNNCCLRRFPYTHNVISCTWRYHKWRLCDVTCDIIMPGKSADSVPDMTLRMRRGYSWTPYWHQSSSVFYFYWSFILCFCCYLVTLCFALFRFLVLPCVPHLHRCGIIMRHNKPPYFKPGLQCCCNLQWSHILNVWNQMHGSRHMKACWKPCIYVRFQCTIMYNIITEAQQACLEPLKYDHFLLSRLTPGSTVLDTY